MNLNEKESIKGCYFDRKGNLCKKIISFDKFLIIKLVESEKEFITPFLSLKDAENFLYSFASEQPSTEDSIFETTVQQLAGLVYLE